MIDAKPFGHEVRLVEHSEQRQRTVEDEDPERVKNKDSKRIHIELVIFISEMIVLKGGPESDRKNGSQKMLDRGGWQGASGRVLNRTV